MTRAGRHAPAAALAALLAAGAVLSACSRPEEIARIEVAGQGPIDLRFLPEHAPHHVENFKKLARSGLYDGTTFHRIAPGLAIEGGDPSTKPADAKNAEGGNAGDAIAAEPGASRHGAGSVSMASCGESGSVGSPFRIALRDPGDWEDPPESRCTVFAEVVDGIEIARRIAWTPRDAAGRPLRDVVITSVRIIRVQIPGAAARRETRLSVPDRRAILPPRSAQGTARVPRGADPAR